MTAAAIMILVLLHGMSSSPGLPSMTEIIAPSKSLFWYPPALSKKKMNLNPISNRAMREGGGAAAAAAAAAAPAVHGRGADFH